MTGILGSGPQIGRSEGFRAELQENFPDVKLVEEQPNNWANDKTISLTQDWLAKYPAGQINAVVAQGPELLRAPAWPSLWAEAKSSSSATTIRKRCARASSRETRTEPSTVIPRRWREKLSPPC